MQHRQTPPTLPLVRVSGCQGFGFGSGVGSLVSELGYMAHGLVGVAVAQHRQIPLKVPPVRGFGFQGFCFGVGIGWFRVPGV